MISFAAPMQNAAALAAVVWPLAAGLALVMWSKVRAAEHRRKLAVIDGGLRGMFRDVASQPVPDRLELVVEALEEQAELASAKAEAPGVAVKVTAS